MILWYIIFKIKKYERRNPMEKVRVTITLDKDILELIDKVSNEKGLQRSTFLNLYLKENLKKKVKQNLL
jgi:metal-responsive CopG/Arc/MetJ family transcriptional regulator